MSSHWLEMFRESDSTLACSCAALLDLGLDPALQGLWYVVALMDPDTGDTSFVSRPALFARARATSITISGGGTVKKLGFEKILIMDAANGTPVNVVHLTSGMSMAVDQLERDGRTMNYFLLQTFDSDLVETQKSIIEIRE